MKKLLRSLVRNESGQGVLLTVLIMVGLGALITVPLLDLMGTGLEAGRGHEERTDEFYAADAGVEDAMYKIKYNQLPDWLQSDWGESAYAHEPYEYSIEPQINGKNTTVAIEPIWVLEGLETPSPQQRREPHDDLITVGNVLDPGQYQIKLIRSEDFPGQLKIERIGCWLPGGFDYVPGSSNLEEDETEAYYCVPQTFAHQGGTAITWDFAQAISYDDLPGLINEKVVTFNYTPQQEPQGTFSWMRTNRNDIYLSWDVACKLYEVTSTATDPVTGTLTTVTAYTSKDEFRKPGSAIAGDYQATGNTLMRDANIPPDYMRERVYEETSATISNVPDNATVEKIFLYWSGWKSSPWNVWGMTEEQQQALPANNKVDVVQFTVEVPGFPAVVFDETVTASLSQVLPNGNPGDPHGWSYSCYVDVTDLLTTFFEDNGVDFVGNATYTVGHAYLSGSGTKLYQWKDNHYNEPVVARTHYPLGSPYDWTGYYQDEWSYAGWSVVVIYTSPQTEGHQLYIYDTFRYCDNAQTLNFTIKNFLAPQDVIDDPQAARITCFVGEGDEIYGAGHYEQYCWSHYGVHDWDCLKLNGYYLSDVGINPWNNVWNSQSNVMPTLSIDGIDIDVFSAGYPIIEPGDNVAQVELPTGIDSWNLVYIILSFRSETTTGGFLSYEVEAG
jgi:hypothetical protein